MLISASTCKSNHGTCINSYSTGVFESSCNIHIRSSAVSKGESDAAVQVQFSAGINKYLVSGYIGSNRYDMPGKYFNYSVSTGRRCDGRYPATAIILFPDGSVIPIA